METDSFHDFREDCCCIGCCVTREERDKGAPLTEVQSAPAYWANWTKVKEQFQARLELLAHVLFCREGCHVPVNVEKDYWGIGYLAEISNNRDWVLCKEGGALYDRIPV